MNIETQYWSVDNVRLYKKKTTHPCRLKSNMFMNIKD